MICFSKVESVWLVGRTSSGTEYQGNSGFVRLWPQEDEWDCLFRPDRLRSTSSFEAQAGD